MLKFDLYKQPFRLLLPDRKNEYRTFAGGLLSITTIIVMLLYTIYKFNVLISNYDYKVQLRRMESYYSEKDVFSYNDGFRLAAAITTDNDDYEKSIDIPPEYASIKFIRKSFDWDDGLLFKELEMRPCKDDFQIGDEVINPKA